MKAHHLFFILFLFGSCHGRAQDTLRINPQALDSLGGTTFALNDSTNGSPSFGVWIYNVSSITTFSDDINFGYAIANGNGAYAAYVASPVDSSGISFSVQSVAIPPHDSILVSGVQVHFTSPDFVIGSSTVVIWPIAIHTPIILLDSASQQVTITGPSGIIDPEIKMIKVYMSGENLVIRNSGVNVFGEIRICSAIGQIINEQKLSQNMVIPMEQYADGIYMIEISLNDGKRAIYKVLKTAR